MKESLVNPPNKKVEVNPNLEALDSFTHILDCTDQYESIVYIDQSGRLLQHVYPPAAVLFESKQIKFYT